MATPFEHEAHNRRIDTPNDVDRNGAGLPDRVIDDELDTLEKFEGEIPLETLIEQNKFIVIKDNEASLKKNPDFTKMLRDKMVRMAHDVNDSPENAMAFAFYCGNMIALEDWKSNEGKTILKRGLPLLGWHVLLRLQSDITQLPEYCDALMVALRTATRDADFCKRFCTDFEEIFRVFQRHKREDQFVYDCLLPLSLSVAILAPDALMTHIVSKTQLVSSENRKYMCGGLSNEMLLKHFDTIKDAPWSDDMLRKTIEYTIMNGVANSESVTPYEGVVRPSIQSLNTASPSLKAKPYFGELLQKGIDHYCYQLSPTAFALYDFARENKEFAVIAHAFEKRAPRFVSDMLTYSPGYGAELLERIVSNREILDECIRNIEKITEKLKTQPPYLLDVTLALSKVFATLGNNNTTESEDFKKVLAEEVETSLKVDPNLCDLSEISSLDIFDEDTKDALILGAIEYRPIDVLERLKQNTHMLSESHYSTLIQVLINRFSRVCAMDIVQAHLPFPDEFWPQLIDALVEDAPDFIVSLKDPFKTEFVSHGLSPEDTQRAFYLNALRTGPRDEREKIGVLEMQDPALMIARNIDPNWLPQELSPREHAQALIVVARYLYFKNMPQKFVEKDPRLEDVVEWAKTVKPTQKEVLSIYQRYLVERARLKNVSLFKGRHVVFASNGETFKTVNENLEPVFKPRFGTEKTIRAIRAQSPLNFDHYGSFENEGEASLTEVKNFLIEKLKNVDPPLTFVFDGHGAPEGMFLSNGQPLPDGTFKNGVYISYQDMVDVFAYRAQHFGPEAIRSDIVIVSACLNQNFQRTMHLQLRSRNLPTPIVITPSEFNRYAYSNYANEMGTDFFDKILNIESENSTFGDVFKNDRNVPAFNPSTFIDVDGALLQVSQETTNTEKDVLRGTT